MCKARFLFISPLRDPSVKSCGLGIGIELGLIEGKFSVENRHGKGAKTNQHEQKDGFRLPYGNWNPTLII